METYKYTEIDNDNILLEKIIIDDTNYTIINYENGNKLLKKKVFINITDIDDIINYDLSKSVICNCVINNKEYNKLKYNSILYDIYNLINDGTKIIINTLLNIKTIKKIDKGFSYLDKIGISVQRVDSNKCILEIIKQSIENNIKIFIKIKTINGIIINIIF